MTSGDMYGEQLLNMMSAWPVRIIDPELVKNQPLDPEATMSHEAWSELLDTVLALRDDEESESRIDSPDKEILGQIICPYSGPNVYVDLSRWVREADVINGRSVSHINIDLSRPGVVTALDEEISYPDKASEGLLPVDEFADEETHTYLSSTGDSIWYRKRSYTVGETSARNLTDLLKTLINVGQKEGDKSVQAMLASFESLEPGLREACERYFVAGKSLAFDPEKEFRVDYRVINDPYRHFGDALFANLPGRIELYRVNRLPSEDKSRRWLRAVWHKEEFPDDTLINEVEPSEDEELTVEEVLAHLPDGAGRDYIKKCEGRWLINTRMLMMKDSGGKRGISPEREPYVRQEYRERYQQYQTLFPDDKFLKDYELAEELPE